MAGRNEFVRKADGVENHNAKTSIFAGLKCRLCGQEGLRMILSFGRTPLADRLLTKEQLDRPEILEPLDLVFCPHCCLVQITVSVDPEILFCQDYPYFSSVSKALLEHSRRNAEELIQERRVGTLKAWWSSWPATTGTC